MLSYWIRRCFAAMQIDNSKIEQPDQENRLVSGVQTERVRKEREDVPDKILSRFPSEDNLSKRPTLKFGIVIRPFDEGESGWRQLHSSLE